MSRNNQSDLFQKCTQPLMGDLDNSSDEIPIESSSNTNQIQLQATNYLPAAVSTESLFHNTMSVSEPYDEDNEETLETLQGFNKMAIELKWNMDTHKKEDQTQQQQPIQSTTTDNKNTNLIKQIQTDIEEIPMYLTKHDPSFQQMVNNIHTTIRTTSSIIIDQTNNKDCIRKIGLLIYKIMVIQTYRILWSTYLKSGLGQLITTPPPPPPPQENQPLYPTNIPIWPKELKVLFLATVNIQINDINNQHYLNFVREQLYLLESALNTCRNQLNILANHFHGYSLPLQNMIRSYIDEHCQPFRLKIQHQTELVRYDYHIRALKLEYLRHRPNAFQELLFKEICQHKYHHALNEQQCHFIQQQIERHKNSFHQTLQNSSLAQTVSTLIDSSPSIDHMRQQLFQQFETIIVEARNDIFQLHTNAFDEQRQISRTNYEESLRKLWSLHYHPKDNMQVISSNMMKIIIERCEKIGERIECIYKFKAQSNLS